MAKVVIFLPVSRADHLDRLFASLEMLECDLTATSLLAYVDGDDKLFSHVKAKTDHAKFNQCRCVSRPTNQATAPFALMERRKRIAAIKNESRDLIGPCDYVFGIEDDTIIPSHALRKLLDDYAIYPYAGLIEGVELGRWGVPYVGAWRADDVYEPTKIESIMPGSGLEEIDAGGFYCYLTKYENYVKHDYAPLGNNDLGPDVNYGIWLRQQGFKNYVD